MTRKLCKQTGYTLVELMVTVGIIGVLVAIAVPAYDDYVETAALAAANQNAESLSAFEDNYFYENGMFLAGTYHPSGDTTTLPNGLDWQPSGDNNLYSYVVAAGPCGSINQCYTITVTYLNDPTIVATLSKP